MQGLRELGNALVIALISISLMIGALSISLVEFVPEAATATRELIPSPALLTATETPLPTWTPTIGLESPTATVTPTFVDTATPPISCPPPFGWVNQIAIQPWDTLDSIAASYRVSKEELRRANCLSSDFLVTGAILYVPPAPTSTFIVCIPGTAGWAPYIVKRGDTIYSIATSRYTTPNILRQVNCRTGDLILAGELLWVPNVATRTPAFPPTQFPTSTFIPTIRSTDMSTQTSLPYTSTVIPTNTSVPATLTTAPTQTTEPALTSIPAPSATLTAFPTATQATP